MWIVLKWTGYIEYKNWDKFEYKENDIIYNPANLAHKIVAQWNCTSEYFFIRFND